MSKLLVNQEHSSSVCVVANCWLVKLTSSLKMVLLRHLEHRVAW